MIVECSNCQTRFQLDDSRIPARGIRVRCSRCKEAFFLEHPSASKAEVVDDVARRAASGAAAPEATRDLPASRSGARTEADEEEWEFNDAPRVDAKAQRGAGAGKRRAAPGKARAGLDDDDAFGGDRISETNADDGPIPGLGVDDMGDDAGLDSTSGLDLAGDAPARGGRDFSGVPDVHVEVGSGGSDFGEASDFSALADEELAAPRSATVSSPKSSAKPAAKSPAAKAPAKPAKESSGESGDTEAWDFFSDDALESPASMDEEPGDAMDVGREESKPRARKKSRGPELGSVATTSPSRFAALWMVGDVVGWLVTLALIGVGVARGVAHYGVPETPAISSVELGDLRAEHVRGSWFETVRSTQLYAVTGKLMNDGLRPVVIGGGLQASLVGADGRPLDLPAVRAGIDLPESDLRELTAEELRTSREQAAAMLAIAPLDPGRWISFQVVFDEMPVQATGFVLEMAEGSAPAPLVAEAHAPAPEVAAPIAVEPPTAQSPEAAAGQGAPAPAPTSSLPPELRASYGAPSPVGSPTEPLDPQPSRP